MTEADVRHLVAGLADTTEQPHHGFPSFRIAGKIFATLPLPGRLNVLLDEHGIHAMVATHPGVCEELWWGRRLRAVRVNLALATPGLVTELLEDAYRRKAPRVRE